MQKCSVIAVVPRAVPGVTDDELACRDESAVDVYGLRAWRDDPVVAGLVFGDCLGVCDEDPGVDVAAFVDGCDVGLDGGFEVVERVGHRCPPVNDERLPPVVRAFAFEVLWCTRVGPDDALVRLFPRTSDADPTTRLTAADG